MVDTWTSGVYVGRTRPIVRATIARVELKGVDSVVGQRFRTRFHQTEAPRELPNVKSVKWERTVDNDAATATIELWNILPGALAAGDLGYFTPNRGRLYVSEYWGQVVNEWADWLVPDRIVRTYEGYGCSPSLSPEDDPHLLITGTWWIDEVTLDSSGNISLSCRDMACVLIDEVAFTSVCQYPLSFSYKASTAYVGTPPHVDATQAAIEAFTGFYPYNDYCADIETEVLTRRGWLTYDEVVVGDEALSIDPETGIAGWQVIESLYRQHRQREMISMESQLHSSLTTPDHRWLVSDQKGRRSWRTTETLRTGHRIPLSAPMDTQPAVAKYDDDFVELVAWFWTEGTSSALSNVVISQSETANPINVDRIRGVLTRLYGAPGRMCRGRGAMWNETRRADGVWLFRLSKPVKDALYELACEAVPSPEFLTALTRAQLENFIERSLDADGWRTTQGRVGLSQRDERRAKAFEMACVLAGRPIRTRLDHNGMWSVNLLRHAVTMPQSTRVERVAYEGVVWCPTLRHSNWLARRQGTVYFTGNTDVVKTLCAWGGLYWPEGAVEIKSNQGTVPLPWTDDFDGVVGGGVWGDMAQVGTNGIVPLDEAIFSKRPLMDGISHIRDIVNFIFLVDEQGAVVWRPPNIWTVGNYRGDMINGRTYTEDMVIIDDEHTLIGYKAALSSRNVREGVYIATADGVYGAYVPGRNPHPSGRRRVAGWTDQRFGSDAECQVMAELIALRQLLTYRVGSVTIPGYPAIQVDDQVRLYERVTGEGFVHYVKGVSSSLDMETGEYHYTLTTHWLGERPYSRWAFDPAVDLSDASRAFLQGSGML